jgi:hypothetical protein
MKKSRASSRAKPRQRRPARQRSTPRAQVKSRASRRDASATQKSHTPLSRTVGDVQDIGRDLGSAGKTLAKGTLRLAYDVGALVGNAGKNVIDGTAALASSFLRSAESLTVPRKPPARARSRRAGGVSPGASRTG